MKSTSLGSSEVSIPAKSPGLSSTGPDVILNPTPSSLAMILLKVVFPNPGGPCSRVWSSGSPLYLAASTNTSRFSTTFLWPLKSEKRRGRRAFSKSLSAGLTLSCLMLKSAAILACSSSFTGAKIVEIGDNTKQMAVFRFLCLAMSGKLRKFATRYEDRKY